jgi:hypothetical protein
MAASSARSGSISILGYYNRRGCLRPIVVAAVNLQNVVLPSGTAKIGSFEYDVDLNFSARTVVELNDLPSKQVGNSTVYLRDVAQASDGFAPQTNIVRQDGRVFQPQTQRLTHLSVLYSCSTRSGRGARWYRWNADRH